MKKPNFLRAAAPLVAAIAALLVLGYGLWRATQPAPEVFQGQMEARETDIAPKVTGRIAQVLVREGEPVLAGAALMRTDNPEVAAKMVQAIAAQQAAQALADKAENGTRPQEIEIARLQWQRAQAAADLALTSFNRLDQLANEGLVAAQKRDESRASFTTARDQALTARAQYELARAGARREDLAAAKAQARSLAGMVSEVQAAQSETELRSPVAGEVAKVLAKVGELSLQGVAVVTVVDLKDQWLVLNVREDRLQRFAKDAEFDAVLPALGGQRIRFRVFHTALMPDFATWRATRAGQGFDVRTFEVKARPLITIEGARPGMSVLVQ